MNCSTIELKSMIAEHGGVLAIGSHKLEYGDAHCPLCILEAVAACRVEQGLMKHITDSPSDLGLPDLRPINDANWSSREMATLHLMCLYDAYAGWKDWSAPRKNVVVGRICVLTVNRIISKLHTNTKAIAKLCESATTRNEAASAASAAASAVSAAAAASAAEAAASAVSAAEAASAAASAASAAAEAGGGGADKILITTVDLWVEAAS